VLGTSGGVRLTGGGFGGCVICLLPQNMVSNVHDAVIKQYFKKTGLKETVYICQTADGVQSIS